MPGFTTASTISEERKAALNAWAAVLAGLESGSKIVAIRGRKD